MREKMDIDVAHSRLAMETELRAVRSRLTQREQTLAILTRRLLQLEGGGGGTPAEQPPPTGDVASENRVLRAQVAALQAELHWLRHSKIFRWSSPVRAAFYAVRRVVRRP